MKIPGHIAPMLWPRYVLNYVERGSTDFTQLSVVSKISWFCALIKEIFFCCSKLFKDS